MIQEISREDLESRVRTVLDRLTFFPDKYILSGFSHGRQILEAAERFGGIDAVFDSLGRATYFDAITVDIPSPEQRLAGTEIALAGMEGRKRFELSKPGTRKTLSALAAIPVINEVLIPELSQDGKKVKTLICCPQYIIPIWIREAERLLHDPNIVVVTRRNRQHAIRRAAEEGVDIVLLGYELSYRRTGIDTDDQEVAQQMEDRYVELLTTVFTRDDAYEILRKVMRKDRFEAYAKKSRKLDTVLRRIVIEEKNLEAASIANALRAQAFNPDGQPYYTIFDEVHNIIDPESATATALAGLYRSAKWGALVTGTGIRNRLSNIAYMAFLDGRIEDPEDFPLVFRDNPRIIRAMFDLDANPIRELAAVDPNVREPKFEFVDYDLSSQEMDVYIGIINSTLFEGKDKYLLLNYLLTNPKKLLPENFRESDDEDSLRRKVEKFFDENPGYRRYVTEIIPSKLATTKEIIKRAAAERRKVIVACEYSSRLTDFLEQELSEFGSVRIDQTVSPQLEERVLTDGETRTLRENGLHTGTEKFRSDLSLNARKLLGIETHDIFYPSPRDFALLEFQTNPEKQVLVVSYGTLREGADVQEASNLIEYESTTVPSRFWQLLARMVRSGKEEQAKVHHLRGTHTLEDAKYRFRDWKDYVIKLVFEGKDATPEELEEFISDTQPDKSAQIGSLLNLNSRAVVIMMLNHLIGQGLDRFVGEMAVHNNALFMAKNYNYQWEYSYSGNCARLIREVVTGLENKIGRRLESIVDEGCGSATVSRTLERRTINIDVNRFQIEYGVEACEKKGLRNNIYYLGSFTNLRHLAPLSVKDLVFDPRKTYEGAQLIEDGSLDLGVCSLAIHFATDEERKEFFRENKRVIRKDGYILLTEPPTKLDKGSREQFLRDLEDIGFEVDRDLTGNYKARDVVNIDTSKREKGNFECYVIVARKKDDNEIVYKDGRTYFRMRDLYDVVPEAEDKEDDCGGPKEPKPKKYICGGFYNTDTGIAPKDIPPNKGTPATPEADDFYQGVASTPEEEITELEAKLRRLLED